MTSTNEQQTQSMGFQPGAHPPAQPDAQPVPRRETRQAGTATRDSAGQRPSDPANTKGRLLKDSNVLQSPTRRPSANDRLSITCKLTERDRLVLRSLDRFRVLTTSQIARLHFPSHKRASMRLLDLLAAGVVDRFRPYREGWGASPWHWVLGRLGAAVVAGERGDDPDKTARRWHGERALTYSDSTRLGHVVGINEFHVSLVHQARYDRDADLLDWRTGPEAARWSEGMATPDAWGMWQEDGRTVEFFVEYDRGTAALRRLAGDLAGYERFEHDRGVTAWVLFAFTSARREQTARDALAGATVPVATATLPDDAGPQDSVWLPLSGPQPRLRLSELAHVPKPPEAVERAETGGRRGWLFER